MSPAPVDRVDAVELAGRAAIVERRLDLDRMSRLAEAGALAGTSVHARLAFDTFDGHPTVAVHVEGVVVLACQRCLRPCTSTIDETATLAIVSSGDEEVPGGHEPLLGDAGHLSLGELIEEQVLLGLPLVAMHADVAQCAVHRPAEADGADASEEKQRPFANLRALLDEGKG